MKYIYMDNERIVREIIPEFSETFPGVAIEKRYSGEFLSRCLEVSNEVKVEQSWEYLPIQNIFLPQIEYTGTFNAQVHPGDEFKLQIEFSLPGQWKLVSDIPVEVVCQIDSIDITAPDALGIYELDILFTDNEYGRTKQQNIIITVEENEARAESTVI